MIYQNTALIALIAFFRGGLSCDGSDLMQLSSYFRLLDVMAM